MRKLHLIPALLGGLAAIGLAMPANAYLFWTRPTLQSGRVTGAEPGIALPLPGAQPKELQAGLIWTMRAGLNVAALQCQFAPALRTTENYNNMLHQHAAELQAAYTDLGGYFKRVRGKTWQTALDDYTTKTYNGFSTLQAQMIFCETASSIGRQTLEETRGHLSGIAADRMLEFRKSLIPIGDQSFAQRDPAVQVNPVDDPRCYNKRGKEIRCKDE